jgi:carboxypeptidase C (cathepsin A)
MDQAQEKTKYEPPKGQQHDLTFGVREHRFGYQVTADWMLIYDKEEPSADIFYTAYLADASDDDRPITFVFNGGPGSSSVFCHLGAMGPKRVRFNDDGTLPAGPAQLMDNAESWLRFTDLVFVDPVGTGFSRKKPDEGRTEGDKPADKKDEKNPYFGIQKDLDSLAQFMQRFLSEFDRWRHPVFIAGESYGGYRVARLARLTHEKYHLGLSGALMISPALEFRDLMPTDYSVAYWINLLPTLAAIAHLHRRTRGAKKDVSREAFLEQVEQFAVGEYAELLAAGDLMPEARRTRVLKKAAAFIGLPDEDLVRGQGRVNFPKFSHRLLEDRREVVGWYDGSVTGFDIFPDREQQESPDPTLFPGMHVFSSGINQWLRQELEVDTDREYVVLNMQAHEKWLADEKEHDVFRQVGAVDDLRHGLSANPHMKTLLCHGVYDQVTPYFASKRLLHQMKLTPEHFGRVHWHTYTGGHMFYTWGESRARFAGDVAGFYSATLESR